MKRQYRISKIERVSPPVEYQLYNRCNLSARMWREVVLASPHEAQRRIAQGLSAIPEMLVLLVAHTAESDNFKYEESSLQKQIAQLKAELSSSQSSESEFKLGGFFQR